MRSFRGAMACPLVTLVAGLALTGCVTDEAAQGPRPAILPIDTLADPGERLSKWVRPIRVSLLGDGAEAQRDFVASRVAALRKLTGHQITMAESGDADLWLVFGADKLATAAGQHSEVFAPLYSGEAAMRADLEDDGEKELCRAKQGMSAENRYEIVYAAGSVPAELGYIKEENCINRLLITALGSAGTKPLSEDQPDKPENHAKIASALEIILLKVWYDDRVKPGMTVAEVQPVMNEKMGQLFKK